MSDDLDEAGQRRRIPRASTPESRESDDSSEQQPLSSESPAYSRRSVQPNDTQSGSERSNDDSSKRYSGPRDNYQRRDTREGGYERGNRTDNRSRSESPRDYSGPRNESRSQYERRDWNDRGNRQYDSQQRRPNDQQYDRGYSSQRRSYDSQQRRDYNQQGRRDYDSQGRRDYDQQPRHDYDQQQRRGYDQQQRRDYAPQQRRDYNRPPRNYEQQRYNDRPLRSDDRSYGSQGTQGPQRTYGDRPYDDRHRGGERPRYNDRSRPQGSYREANRDSYRDRDSSSRGYGGRQDFRGRRSTQQRPTNITKALVRLLFASRGFSLKAIREGIVSLNDQIVRNPNAAVRLLQDEVRVDGVLMGHNPSNVYVVMNKPKKFAGSREQESRHVMNLISKKSGWYIPGGPLAKSVSGIFILTNDPEQSDPQNNMFALMDKEYRFKVNKVITKKDISKLAARVEELHEENKGRVVVEIAQKNTRDSWIGIVVRRARVQQLSKAVSECGVEILAIERRRIGSISVDELPAGSWRRMSEDEMQTVITSSVSRASVEERVEQHPDVTSDEPSVWQKLYQRWFKSI